MMAGTKKELDSVDIDASDAAKAAGKKIQTRKVVVDFTKTHSAEAIEKLCRDNFGGLNVSVLHNNACSVTEGKIQDLKSEDVHDMITSSVYPLTLIAKEVVKIFIDRYHANNSSRSLIVNSSSACAMVPVPGMGILSAAKNYADFFSQGICYELKRYRVDSTSWRIMGDCDHDSYVQAAYGKCNYSIQAGLFSHELVHMFWKNLNDLVSEEVSMNFFSRTLAKVKRA